MAQTTLPIFELGNFYRLSIENQRQVKIIIDEEYALLGAKNKLNLRHFVARYFQLSKAKREKVNVLVDTLYRQDRQPNRRYEEYRNTTDYGMQQLKKSPHLFSERFVAFDTPYELGLKGELRFKVDCSSGITVAQLQDEMNSAFLAKAVKQRSSSKVIGINFTACRKITNTQVELLQEMLSTCQAELLVDICGDDAIKLKNPWNAVMIMQREADTGRTILQGDKTVVQNFSRRVNSFF